jgi:hypothetical protein
MGIKNKSIEAGAGIDPSKIAGGINSFFIPNNVRRVIQTSTTNFKYANKIIDMMPSGMVYTGNAGLATAVSALDEADVLYIHAGDAVYETGAVMDVVANRVKILGQCTNDSQWGSPSLHVHGTDTHICMNVLAHQVEVAGIAFHMQRAYAALKLGGSASTYGASFWRNHVHDVFFGANATATYGIDAGTDGPGSTDLPSTQINDCTFVEFVTAGIYSYLGGYSKVRNCTFMVPAAGIGIEHITNSSSRPFVGFLDNLFISLDATAGTCYGIKVTNTPSAGYFYMDGNRFLNFHGDDHCITKRTTGTIGRNYHNDGGATGTTIQIA